MVPFPEVISQVHVAGWWWHWIVPTIEGVEFCSYWTRHSTYRLAFLYAMLLPKLSFMKKENALYTIMVFHTALLLINKLTPQQKECSNRPTLMGFAVLPYFPSSWSSWFDKMVKWPFEYLVTAPYRWQYLGWLGQGSPEGCICSISIQCMVLFLPQPGLIGPRVRKRVASLIINSRNPLAKFLLSVPIVIWPTGLEVSKETACSACCGLGP